MHSRNAIIIALGQPSDPLPHDATMRAMAEKVQALMPGWTIRGATLESKGSVALAAEGLDRPLVYPLFLANGFFMAQVLPKRLARIVPDATVLAPFGMDKAIPALVADVVAAAAKAHGYAVAETSLLLAAHGSEMFPASRLSTEQLAQDVAALAGFRKVVCGFIEEAPFIAQSARELGQAICLPVFALCASHVAVDVPEALATAGFTGPVLEPLGMHEQVPSLIASALRAHVLREAA